MIFVLKMAITILLTFNFSFHEKHTMGSWNNNHYMYSVLLVWLGSSE